MLWFGMRNFLVSLVLPILLLNQCHIASGLRDKPCGPGTKEGPDKGGSCVSLVSDDITHSLNWMANPPSSNCSKVTTVQGIAVCEDNMPRDCLIWSEISSMWCDDIGTLEFEKYWSKRCDVVIYHFFASFKGNTCSQLAGASWPELPRLSLVRNDMWGGKCYNCLFKYIKIPSAGKVVDVLKVQQRSNYTEDFDGVQYTVLSDLFLHQPELSQVIDQIVMITSYTPQTLTDR